MDKKPLIVVSICAVVLLVLGSLSNVVGYQSVKSTAVNDSPLFQTRTQRAINQEQKIITSQYLGKGINALSFPLRDTNTKMIQKFIDRIRTMDDDTFNRFVDYAINKINHKNSLELVNVDEFIKELRQLRKSNQYIIVYKDSNNNGVTYFRNDGLTTDWFPGCILLNAIRVLLGSICYLFIIFIYYVILTRGTFDSGCHP